jgi:hypothetical protein
LPKRPRLNGYIFELNVERYRRKMPLPRKSNDADPVQPTKSDASTAIIPSDPN